MSVFKTITYRVQFCVVGGGLSGLCAAVEAARRGVKVAVMQDRPMLGGNASSEMRMWVLGARGKDNRETGIVEELFLENYYRNPYKNFSIWDSILWEIVRFEKNITLILNCSCMDAEVKEGRILSVTGWQTTTQMYHKVEAPLFADCSGDSVLAPLSGAEYRVGHEAHAEFGEDIAPVYADKKTMGNSILIQARETGGPRTFIPPPWAEKFTKEKLPYRLPDLTRDDENFWYLELGGVRDTIADAEEIRDELLAAAYGMWDFVKNDPENREKFAAFDLDWIGFLPGKRESRRYVGDHTLTQADVRAGGNFEDVVAYGGWPMDDHHPEALRTPEEPTVFHPAPSPFGVPYRCLYSWNVENLFFAGRNISVSHVALSSTRVMATCAILGQAVGAAAAVAVRHGETPRGVYRNYTGEVQQMLMEDDCWLPGLARKVSALTAGARLSSSKGNADVLRNGVDRPTGAGDNGLWLAGGDYAEYRFDKPVHCRRVRLVFDSDLNRETQREGSIYKRPMYATYYLDIKPTHVPKTMIKSFRLTLTLADGGSRTIDVGDNHRRLVYADIGAEVSAVRFEPLSTWGNAEARLFSFEIE
ncbi:MAG: FAD-dependent oxidoreductase [Treponema sp.]|nr:FAD-dependent oxidoreductase [Treponema sp.]